MTRTRLHDWRRESKIYCEIHLLESQANLPNVGLADLDTSSGGAAHVIALTKGAV